MHITDEAMLGKTINRVILWLAKHGPPVAGMTDRALVPRPVIANGNNAEGDET